MNKIAIVVVSLAALAASSIATASTDEEFRECFQTDLGNWAKISAGPALNEASEFFLARNQEPDRESLKLYERTLSKDQLEALKVESYNYALAFLGVPQDCPCKKEPDYLARVENLEETDPMKKMFKDLSRTTEVAFYFSP